MNRINKVFNKLKELNRPALITYVCAGDPDLDTTYNMVMELEKAGADIVELGIPFSDPIADGPTIQRAAQRALSCGTNLSNILDMVTKLRAVTQIPIVLMGYYNPFLAMGLNEFIERASMSGVDGLIIPDIPPDEADEIIKKAKEKELSTIFLLAPTSTESRINLVSSISTGFIYFVSVTGVTGARNSQSFNIEKYIKNIKSKTDKPVCVGFGISNTTQIQQIAQYGADGIIVGSAFVNIIEENLSNRDKIPLLIGGFCRSLVDGLKR